MTNVTQFPSPVSVGSFAVVVLSCARQPHFDPAPLIRLFELQDFHEAEEILCRTLEDIALRLDLLQRGLAAHDFQKMLQPVQRIVFVADQIGLVEVGVAATHVCTCLKQQDGIGLDATMARLERNFDIAVNEVWNFRDL